MCAEIILRYYLWWYAITNKGKKKQHSLVPSFTWSFRTSSSSYRSIAKHAFVTRRIQVVNKSASSSLETFLVPLRWATLRDALTYTRLYVCTNPRVHRHAFATYEHIRLHTYNQARIKSVPKKERKLLSVDMKSDVG